MRNLTRLSAGFALLSLLSASPARTAETAGQAMLWSMVNTAVPLGVGIYLSNNGSGVAEDIGGGMILYGLLVGPSIGNYYLGDGLGGTVGMVSRGGGGVLMLAGFAMALGCAFSNMDNEEGSNTCNESAPLILAGAGAGAYIGGTIWNLGRLPGAARRNEAREAAAAAKGPRLAAQPTWAPQSQAVGMRLSLQY